MKCLQQVNVILISYWVSIFNIAVQKFRVGLFFLKKPLMLIKAEFIWSKIKYKR